MNEQLPQPIKRRAFITKTSAGPLALAGAPLLWGQENKFRGANDRVRVAVIGIHGMGQSHITAYSKLPNVEVAGWLYLVRRILILVGWRGGNNI